MVTLHVFIPNCFVQDAQFGTPSIPNTSSRCIYKISKSGFPLDTLNYIYSRGAVHLLIRQQLTMSLVGLYMMYSV